MRKASVFRWACLEFTSSHSRPVATDLLFCENRLLLLLQVLIRWTLPRFRYDQMMSLFWKGILPLAVLNILFTGILLLLIRN